MCAFEGGLQLAKDRWRAGDPLRQASLTQNAQWRSQSATDLWRIKPFAEFCNIFAGHNTRTYLKNSGSGFRARRGMAKKRSPPEYFGG